MACLKATPPTLPTLPGGIGFGVTTPGFSGNPALCCKTPPWPYPLPPTPLGGGLPVPAAILAAYLIALQVAEDALLVFCDQLTVDCPFE